VKKRPPLWSGEWTEGMGREDWGGESAVVRRKNIRGELKLFLRIERLFKYLKEIK
jgi:hypothetical protein